MITETDFYGGARRDVTSASVQLHRLEPRFRTFRCTSAGHVVTMPPASHFLPHELGADWAVHNEAASSQSFTLKATINGVLTTLGTIAPGSVVTLFLTNRGLGTEMWKMRA